MDRRSWPWKKKSSEKSEKAAAPADPGGINLTSGGSQGDNKGNYKKPNYVQISVESYTHLTGLEEQIKTYEEQVKTYDEQAKTYEQQVEKLENKIKELNENLSAAQSEMTTKENLVKQHAKVAEEAVSGWEKAEAEALALKNHLESVTLSKLTVEDRASHLDGALKECMRQIRNLKEEHEQKLQEVVTTKAKQLDKIRMELEAKIANLDQELLRSEAENAAITRSLQERSNMLIKISEEKSQAEAEIELLKSNIESCEREINTLKYELHVVAKELEIRNEEKNMSVRSADAANKQHMEGVKKIAKLEAECQRLRGLVRKKLPGPAALAQMKLEVESLGREYGDSRLRRSPVKPSSPHLSAVSEFSLDCTQKLHKEKDFLTDRLLAMEEETKMLKEALAMRNSELQDSRNLCAKTTSRLQSLEAQIVNNQQKSFPKSTVQVSVEGYSSQNASNPPSLTSLSEDGNDDNRSCANSWATGLISKFSQFKKETNGERSSKVENKNNLELMDDFLEMEKLACLNSNGAIITSDCANGKRSEIVKGDVSGEVSSCKDTQSEGHRDLDVLVSNASSQLQLSAGDSGFDPDQQTLVRFQSRISKLLENVSKDADIGKILGEVKLVVQDACDTLHHNSGSSVSDEVHSDAMLNGQTSPEDAGITGEKMISLSEDSKIETLHKLSQELATAVSQIHDFVLFLGKEAMAVHLISVDGNALDEKIQEFSVTFNKVLSSESSLTDFVFGLSHVLAKAGELRFNLLGFKGCETEISSPDCIDKVALPENKVADKDSSGEGYQNNCDHVSSPNSNPEVPDDGHLMSSYVPNGTSCKISLEEFEELKLAKESMAVDLAKCSENLEITKSQLRETEQLLAEIKSQLTYAKDSNSLAETQLKCMAESYRALESRASEVEAEVNLLRSKAETLENELQVEKRGHDDALNRCNELQDLLQKNESCSVCSSAADVDPKTKQEKELTAAAEKLAECQETIFLLGRQLKALRPQTELIESPQSERSQRGEDEPTSTGINLQEFDQVEIDTATSANLHGTGAESPVDLYNSQCSPSDTETNLLTSPSNSKHPKNRSSKSSSSSTSSTPTPEKHSRGFSRFFSSKGGVKNSY
ncbi:hypothetical protein K2173_007369 [Erythroxylum novogranatense]|uniref:Filament-like plant protein 4 n=1 Tax=Erythroxylum novogranatense TaxID=1862640 RepID=A0AAV8T7L5_9ROSI|nr:hypothetical protein K2173_007369 [Erythroxylum novogranatense]